MTQILKKYQEFYTQIKQIKIIYLYEKYLVIYLFYISIVFAYRS